MLKTNLRLTTIIQLSFRNFRYEIDVGIFTDINNKITNGAWKEFVVSIKNKITNLNMRNNNRTIKCVQIET